MRISVVGVSVIIAASFALGRVSAPERVKVQTQVREVRSEAKNTLRTAIRVVRPDGTKETRIVTETKVDTLEGKSSERLSEVTRATDGLTIQALAGYGYSVHSVPSPTYGVAISKPLAGPIVLGAWWLINSQIVGISGGLRF